MPTWKNTPERASRPTYLEGTAFTSAGVIDVSRSYGLAASCLATPRGWEIQRAGAKPGNRELIVTLRDLGSTAKVNGIAANAANGDLINTPTISWVCHETVKGTNNFSPKAIPVAGSFTHRCWISSSCYSSGVTTGVVTGLDINTFAPAGNLGDATAVTNAGAAGFAGAFGSIARYDVRGAITGRDATSGLMAQITLTVTFTSAALCTGGPNLATVNSVATNATAAKKVLSLYTQDAGVTVSRDAVNALSTTDAGSTSVMGDLCVKTAQQIYGNLFCAGPEVLIPTITLSKQATTGVATIPANLFTGITGATPTITWVLGYTAATAATTITGLTTNLTFAGGSGPMSGRVITLTNAAAHGSANVGKYLTAIKVVDGGAGSSGKTVNLFVILNVIA